MTLLMGLYSFGWVSMFAAYVAAACHVIMDIKLQRRPRPLLPFLLAGLPIVWFL